MAGDGRRRRLEYRMIALPDGRTGTLLPARLLCVAEGWAMVRRAGASQRPFVIAEDVWAAASLRQEEGLV